MLGPGNSVVDRTTPSDPESPQYFASSGSLDILPEQHGNDSASGACGIDNKQFCPYAWNASYFGSGPPRTPPNATDIEVYSSTRNLTICGNKCKHPQDCSPSTKDHGCKCAYPFPEDAIKLGFDPVFPIAVCLVLAYVFTDGIGARGTQSFMNDRGEEYRCLCNETFAAPECCGSKDGILY